MPPKNDSNEPGDFFFFFVTGQIFGCMGYLTAVPREKHKFMAGAKIAMHWITMFLTVDYCGEPQFIEKWPVVRTLTSYSDQSITLKIGFLTDFIFR